MSNTAGIWTLVKASLISLMLCALLSQLNEQSDVIVKIKRIAIITGTSFSQFEYTVFTL